MSTPNQLSYADTVTANMVSAHVKRFADVLNEHGNELTTLGHSKALHRFAEAMGYANWHALHKELTGNAFKATLRNKYGLSDAYAESAWQTLDNSLIESKEGDALADYYCFRYNITPLTDKTGAVDADSLIDNTFHTLMVTEVLRVIERHNDGLMNYLQGLADGISTMNDVVNGNVLFKYLRERFAAMPSSTLAIANAGLERIAPQRLDAAFRESVKPKLSERNTPFTQIQRDTTVSALTDMVTGMVSTLLFELNKRWSDERDYISDEPDDLQQWLDRHAQETINRLLRH